MYFPANQRHALGGYSRSRLPDSTSSGTASSGRGRSFRMEQALSGFDALRMPSGAICYPLVAVGQNAFKSNKHLAT